MPSTSPPKGRSVTWCDAIASSAACRSRPATRRDFPNTSPRGFRSPRPGATRCCAAFMPPPPSPWSRPPSLMAELAGRGFEHLGTVDARRRHRAVPAGARDRSRSAAAALRQRRTDCGREEPRGLPRARPARLQGRDRPRAARGGAAPPLSRCKVSRPAGGRALAAHLAAADVFVFPSKTDTFGVVQLEALACGVPVAAYPVTGPRDVIGEQSDRRARRRSAPGVHGGARDVARRPAARSRSPTPGRAARASSSVSKSRRNRCVPPAACAHARVRAAAAVAVWARAA